MGFDDVNLVGDSQQHCIDMGCKITCNVYDPENLQSLNAYNHSLLHLNIRSLNKHHTDFTSLLCSSKCHFDVIGCSETGLNDSTYVDLLNIEGYNLFIKNKSNRTGGGVCLYVKNSLQVKMCELALEDQCDQCESLFIEINGNDKSLIVGVLYRPPNSALDTFFHNLGALLHKINKLQKDCILLGDYNIDISKEDGAKHDFLNTLHSNSFFHTISRFTRVTQSSKSIIDNIITNIQHTKLETGVILSDITDHFPIAMFYGMGKPLSPPLSKITSKIIKESTLQDLMANLQAKCWDTVYDCNP